MKNLIERLAAGNCEYETSDGIISENKISVELFPDESVRGQVHFHGKNNTLVKGVVFSTDNHLEVDHQSFEGHNIVISYEINSRNLVPGHIVNGTMSIVTTAGDFAIPFLIKVREKKLSSTLGDLNDLKDFVNLVQKSYDEALILFLSKDFKKFFLRDDVHAACLYHQVMKNSNRHIALEEFLVGMGLKERVRLSALSDIRELTDINENYSESFIVKRSTWGYVDVDVKASGDFFYNVQKKITGDDFNGNSYEYKFYINSSKLHGGSNHGRITLDTSYESLNYDVVIVNKKNNIVKYIGDKKTILNILKRYLDFRTGMISVQQWAEETGALADERLSEDPKDITGLMAKAQIAIVNNDTEKVLRYFNRLSAILIPTKKKDIYNYCYFLYLRSLYKNDSKFTDDVIKEIRGFYDGGYDSWKLLWILFYTDSRYDENPSLKYTMIKRAFGNGCHSPIMYYEAASVILNQPELLRILNDFELQVLNFIAKYHMSTDAVLKQAALIMENERTVTRTQINVLKRLYGDRNNADILTCLCQKIISINDRDPANFCYFKAGVVSELKITGLYEYYIYTANTEEYPLLENGAYKYFSYGTESLAFNRDYLLANVVENRSRIKDFERYRRDLEHYVTDQMLKGKNNRHLRIVYSYILNDSFVVGDMAARLAEITHTYEITVDNEKARKVVICHKETRESRTEELENGRTYFSIYTKDPVIMFVDSKGRYLSKLDYSIEPMTVDSELTLSGENSMTRLMELDDILDDPINHRGKTLELKAALESDVISSFFRSYLREFIVEYYYKNLDEGDLDIFILQFNMAELSPVSRNRIMEIMIDRGMEDMVFSHIARYGYQGLSKDRLISVCESLVKRSEYQNNELLVEMCGMAFRNGCRNTDVLKFIGKYYETGSLELYQIFLAVKSREIDDNTLAERILVQLIFEGCTDERIHNIFNEYVKYPSRSKIRKAYYTYTAYNYFIKKVQCPDSVWEYIEEEYSGGVSTPIISRIAFIEVMSKKDSLTDNQINICQRIINDLADDNINFEFFKKFSKWFSIPYNLVDKTIIDYRTNPKHRVEITYSIKSEGKDVKPVSEEMNRIYPGIFTKEIIVFYGEEINYTITEYDEGEDKGRDVDKHSVRITDKYVYNDESRFGMINGMMICRSLGRNDAAREIMQNYELEKMAGIELFKLL